MWWLHLFSLTINLIALSSSVIGLPQCDTSTAATTEYRAEWSQSLQLLSTLTLTDKTFIYFTAARPSETSIMIPYYYVFGFAGSPPAEFK